MYSNPASHARLWVGPSTLHFGAPSLRYGVPCAPRNRGDATGRFVQWALNAPSQKSLLRLSAARTDPRFLRCSAPKRRAASPTHSLAADRFGAPPLITNIVSFQIAPYFRPIQTRSGISTTSPSVCMAIHSSTKRIGSRNIAPANIQNNDRANRAPRWRASNSGEAV